MLKDSWIQLQTQWQKYKLSIGAKQWTTENIQRRSVTRKKESLSVNITIILWFTRSTFTVKTVTVKFVPKTKRIFDILWSINFSLRGFLLGFGSGSGCFVGRIRIRILKLGRIRFQIRLFCRRSDPGPVSRRSDPVVSRRTDLGKKPPGSESLVFTWDGRDSGAGRCTPATSSHHRTQQTVGAYIYMYKNLIIYQFDM